MSTQLMRRYLDIINERVSIGPDGQVTGGFKPNLSPVAEPAAPTDTTSQPPAPTIPTPSDGVKVDRTTGMLSYQGREYEITKIMPDGPQPRLPPNNVKVKVACADVGYRCLGAYDAVLYGDRAYVYIR
jgi:hypothetical protein